MREPQDETIDNDKVSSILHETFKSDVPEGLDARMSAALSDFREDLENHPYVRRLEAGGTLREALRSLVQLPPMARLAGLVGAGAVLVLLLVPLFLGNGTPTWAQVVERFRSVDSFYAVVYARKDAFAESEQFELWANAAGDARMRAGTQTLFLKNGTVTKAFDLAKREETRPGIETLMLLSSIDSPGSFSLDTLMREIGGEWVDSTPQLNTDAVVSEDLVVFDVQELGGENWIRVWALRESKLPIQLRYWEPHDGECMDVFYSYSKDQPRAFYDPDQFAEKLQDKSLSDAKLAYAFLKDPGEKQVEPGSLNEAYVFSTVTRTLEGEPWSLGNHRGKVALVGFWNTSSGYEHLDWWKEIYRDYGAREDFVMAGVALDNDAEPVRTYCRDHGIEWLQLHEPGKERANTLAKAFGGHVEGTMWLIWKDGRLEPLGHAGDQVKAALLGLSYETHSEITPHLSHRIGEGNGLSREEAQELCGEPGEIATQDGRETWTYRLTSKDKTSAYEVTLTFDSAGKNTNLISQHRLLNPALAKVFVGERFWKDKVEAAINPDLLPAQSHRYGVAMMAKSGLRASFIGVGHPWTSVEPGQEYLRQMEPGTYDFYVVVCDKRTFEIAQEIPLVTGIELVVGETREVRVE